MPGQQQRSACALPCPGLHAAAMLKHCMQACVVSSVAQHKHSTFARLPPIPRTHTSPTTQKQDTCPFPASEQFPATIIGRNVTVMSLSLAALAAAAAAGAPLDAASSSSSQVAAAAADGPFWINCAHMDGRFQLSAGRRIEYNSVVLVDCRTLSTAGFITKRRGSTLVLNNTVENQGSVCLPLPTAQGVTNGLPHQPGLPAPAGRSSSQQVTSFAGPGSNWCAATPASSAAGSNPPLAAALLPALLANRSNSATCQQSALLLGSTAWLETPTRFNASRGTQQSAQEPFTMLAYQLAILCPQPVSNECVRENGTGAQARASEVR